MTFPLHEAVKTLLWEQWDPIGLRAIGGPSDEYDSYAFEVWKMLVARTSADEIAAYLAYIETKHMGLSNASGRAHTVAEIATATAAHSTRT